MGAIQSYIPPEAALTTVAVAGAIAYGYLQTRATSASGNRDKFVEGTDLSSSSVKKGKKKKRGDGAPASSARLQQSTSASDVLKSPPPPTMTAIPDVIPGEFDLGGAAGASGKKDLADQQKPKKKTKKNKKNKAKQAIIKDAVDDSGVPGMVSPFSDTRSVASSEDGAGGDSLKSLSLSHLPAPTTTTSTTTTASTSQARSPPLTRPHKQSTTSIDTDGSWTRVETRRGKRRNAPNPASISTTDMSHPLAADATTSDAGATSVTTGNSSPVAERGMEHDDDDEHEEVGGEGEGEEADEEDEGEPFLASIAREQPAVSRKTLAEKLLPKPRKTGVDDMTETPDYPTLARVIRVQPRPDEKPASGFSWGDYEDVDTGGTGGDNEADGEDDGWGVVRRNRPKRRPADSTAGPGPSSSSASTPSKAPETMTKRQRQNANRREAEKAAKEAAEADRLTRLAKHKNDLDHIRMKEQHAGRK